MRRLILAIKRSVVRWLKKTASLQLTVEMGPLTLAALFLFFDPR
jgi:hypothetical protein